MSERSNCPICCERWNKSTRCKIECPGCRRRVCRSCIQTYLLQIMNEPKCMYEDCSREWSLLFLRQSLPRSFVDHAYRQHRENMLLEREKSFIPQTMPILECKNQIRQVQRDIRKAIRKVKEAQFEQRRLEENLIESQNRLDGLYYQAGHPVQSSENNHKVEYKRPCPVEGCPAYLHPQTGKCDACSQTTCLKCNIVLSSFPSSHQSNISHECQSDDILQWNAIRENTKPCPGCKTFIYKVSGCNQMWCSQCHTPFAWDTGRIERGPIHNPEYYDWMFGDRTPARIGAVEGGQGCRREGQQEEEEPVSTRQLRHALDMCLSYRPEEKDKNGEPFSEETINKWTKYVLSTHRYLNHLFDITLPKMGNQIGNPVRWRRVCLDLRIEFLLKEISEEEFKRHLQRTEKAHQKTREYEMILETLVNIWMSQFVHFCFPNHENEVMTLYDLYRQLKQGLKVANGGIETLNQIYHSNISPLNVFSF